MLHSKKILRIISDLLALNFSFLLANYYLYPDSLFDKDIVTLGIISNLLWFATLAASNRLYGRFEYTRFRVELKSVLKNYILHLVFFSLFFKLLWEGSTLYLLIFYLPFFFLVLCFRFIIHLWLPRLRNIQTLNYITIGYSSTLVRIERTIKDAHLNKTVYLGSFGDNIIAPYKRIGKINSVYNFLQQNPTVNMILYTSTNQLSSGQLRQLVNYSKLNFIDFKIIPPEVELLTSGIKMEVHDGFPLLSIKDENVARIRNRFIKRVFDIIFSSLVIIFILSWLGPLIGILIKRESKGPIFFSQTRRGLKNRKFTCFKFRSMVVNTQSDLKQATKGDSRITNIGAFMRRTNIDELPQFFNVLLGDMSVVGPRPHPLKLDEDLSSEMEEYILRYYIKPGVTGWAQVNGFRGPTETEESKQGRTSHDLWYLRNWSFWLDIKIIFLTVFGSKVKENAF